MDVYWCLTVRNWMHTRMVHEHRATDSIKR